MFQITGKAIFQESDMHLGEDFKSMLINQGFYVNTNYKISDPIQLIVEFNVSNMDVHKPDTEFDMSN